MRANVRVTHSQRGGALLAVLWVSAALSAMAFAMASTVRGETERTSTFSESVRAYYLATGAIERMRLYAEWGGGERNPDNTPKFYEPGMSRVAMNFPQGTAVVEIIPETARLSLNTTRPEELMSLLTILTGQPDRARQIAAAIVDWRSPVPGELSLFDQYYLSLTPSFRARHSSFLETEELLFVKGITPDLFYGAAGRDEQGRLLPIPGLRDCVSVYGSQGLVDINHAEPPVLGAIGLAPEAIAAIVNRRRVAPYRNANDLSSLAQLGGPGARRLMIGGNTIFTYRATAQLRKPDGQPSDLKRTVSATLKYHQKPVNTPPVEVLRWYDY